MENFDVAVVGAGPAGLSAAEVIAQSGLSVIVLEKNSGIGIPVRSSGASVIKELQKLGIDKELWHPISRVRFASPGNSALFEYREPVACVVDVRRLYQWLAEKASLAGAEIRLKTEVFDILREPDNSIVIKAWRNGLVEAKVKLIIDASGFSSIVARKLGIHGVFQRYGFGAEYELCAPNYDQRELVLVVGNAVAPSGYGWAFPCGGNKVRLGVGVTHPDTKVKPIEYLDSLAANVSVFGDSLKSAKPIEFHEGFVPAEDMSKKMVANEVILVGDAAAQASPLVGEGIRFCIKAGRLAGETAVRAFSCRDFSENFLYNSYQKKWETDYSRNMQIAMEINKIISRYSDSEWDQRVNLLKSLTPELFAEALQTNFSFSLILRVGLNNPSLLPKGMPLLSAYIRSLKKTAKG